MYIKILLRYLIGKINSLERKADFNYSSNPFGKHYTNTIVWVDDEHKII